MHRFMPLRDLAECTLMSERLCHQCVMLPFESLPYSGYIGMPDLGFHGDFLYLINTGGFNR